MKFSNGCWLQKEHTACFSPAHVYDARIGGESVRLCCPTTKIRHRGDTLGGVNLTVEFSAPREGMLRVRAWHYAGVREKGPAFELNLEERSALRAEATDGRIIGGNTINSL